MATAKNRVPIRGSERAAVPGSRVLGPADSTEQVEVTVRLRPRTAIPSPADMAAGLAERRHLTHEEFRKNYGANPQDLARIKTFAQDHGLKVVESSAARRSVVLAGNVADLSAAFGVELQRYQVSDSDITFRGRLGAVHIPPELEPIVEGVFGLDDRPQAKAHFRILTDNGPATAHASTSTPTGPRPTAR